MKFIIARHGMPDVVIDGPCRIVGDGINLVWMGQQLRRFASEDLSYASIDLTSDEELAAAKSKEKLRHEEWILRRALEIQKERAEAASDAFPARVM